MAFLKIYECLTDKQLYNLNLGRWTRSEIRREIRKDEVKMKNLCKYRIEQQMKHRKHKEYRCEISQWLIPDESLYETQAIRIGRTENEQGIIRVFFSLKSYDREKEIAYTEKQVIEIINILCKYIGYKVITM